MKQTQEITETRHTRLYNNSNIRRGMGSGFSFFHIVREREWGYTKNCSRKKKTKKWTHIEIQLNMSAHVRKMEKSNNFKFSFLVAGRTSVAILDRGKEKERQVAHNSFCRTFYTSRSGERGRSEKRRENHCIRREKEIKNDTEQNENTICTYKWKGQRERERKQ